MLIKSQQVNVQKPAPFQLCRIPTGFQVYQLNPIMKLYFSCSLPNIYTPGAAGEPAKFPASPVRIANGDFTSQHLCSQRGAHELSLLRLSFRQGAEVLRRWNLLFYAPYAHKGTSSHDF